MKSKLSQKTPPSPIPMSAVAQIAAHRLTAGGVPVSAAVTVHRGENNGNTVSVTIGNRTVYLSRARARPLSSAIWNASHRWGG